MASQNPNVLDNRFWLQFMQANAQYILYTLPYIQTKDIEQAQTLIKRFDSLYQSALGNVTDEQLKQLNQDAYDATQNFRKFILHILKGKIDNSIMIYLLPSQLNNMVNRTEEYLNILAAYMQNKLPDPTPVHLSLAWLLDAYWQAVNIASNVDLTYKDLKSKATEFAENLNALFMRALVLNGMLRTGLTQFPAIDQLSADTADQMLSFYQFISELQTLAQENKIFGNFYPLLLDQLRQETCYYLIKLSEISKIPHPDCNPYNKIRNSNTASIYNIKSI